MKLKESTIESVVIGSHKSKQFRISDNKIIYDILRNKLYENPIFAICREVSSNSRDANREAGRADVPVVIEIQQHLVEIGISGDLAIAFHDNGPGITPTRMDDVFLAYGESTKRDSNEQTGGYGLGAKTPFAYSDTFSVKTVCDVDGKRMKYFYIAGLDKEQKGTMHLFKEEPTEDQTGTTITVPIKSQDREKFENGCFLYTCMWSVTPTYKNFRIDTSNIPLDVQGTAIKGGAEEMFNGFRAWIFKPGKTNPFAKFSNGLIILVDGIPFPYPDEFAGRLHVTAPSWGTIVLPFENGVLDLSGSREAVQTTEDNYKIIRERITVAKNYMTNWLQKYIDAMPNVYRASYIYYLFSHNSSLANPIDELKLPVMFNTFLGNGNRSAKMYRGKKVEFDIYNAETFRLQLQTYDRFSTQRKKSLGNDEFDFFGTLTKAQSLSTLSKPSVYVTDPLGDKKMMQRVNTAITRDRVFVTRKDFALHDLINSSRTYVWAGQGQAPWFNAQSFEDAKAAGQINLKELEKVQEKYDKVRTLEEGLINEFFETKQLLAENPTPYSQKSSSGSRAAVKKNTILVRYRTYSMNDRSSSISYSDWSDEVDANKPVFADHILQEVQSVAENKSSGVDKSLTIALLVLTAGTKYKVGAAAKNYKAMRKMGAMTPREFIDKLTKEDFDRIKKILLWGSMSDALSEFVMLKSAHNKEIVFDEDDKKIFDMIIIDDNVPNKFIRDGSIDGYVAAAKGGHLATLVGANKLNLPTDDEIKMVNSLPAKYPMFELLSMVDDSGNLEILTNEKSSIIGDYMRSMQILAKEKNNNTK